jgi:hypothetical protein
LILNGVPPVVSRSMTPMPPRGLWSNLSTEDVRRVAAYAWVISQTRGEPWPGGHAQHAVSADTVLPRTTGP